MLDEIHKYADFAQHLKTIYDLSNLCVIFTGSSATHILNVKADLSRRASIYGLEGLSFREFLGLDCNVDLPTFELEEVLEEHEKIAANLQIYQPKFKKYLTFG